MYLLDTNVLSELMRRQPNPQLEARFASEPGELFASAITVEEIRYGARIGPPGNRLWERAEADLLDAAALQNVPDLDVFLGENRPSRSPPQVE